MIDPTKSNVGRRMSLAFWLTASCFLLSNAVGQVKENGLPNNSRLNAEETMALLKRLASDDIASDDSFLGKTRFAIDLRASSLLYDMTPIPAGLVLSSSDPLSIPLEAMIRAEALQRDLQKSLPTESFWVVPLANVQKSIKNCVDSLVQLNGGLALQEKENDCSGMIEQQIQYLGESVQSFAKDRRLVLTQSVAERSPAIGYKVRVSIEPPKARVRFMTMLEYKKCINSKSSLTDQWNDMVAGDINLIGRYHYLAEWPPDLNGPEEGNFEIQKPGTITFRPRAK
jgi:hypothetical protein